MTPARNTIAEWTVTVLLLLFATTSLVQAFVIPTGSMGNNLLVGDQLLVDRLTSAPAGSVSRHLLPYSEVKRGDVIVFRFPMRVADTYVKRVIGLPGDRLGIEAKQVLLNGRTLDEPYKVHSTPCLEPYRDTFPAPPNRHVQAPAVRMLAENIEGGELVVPAGMYFALGGNRDNSLDSRYWGFVPRENIIGEPLVIYWSSEQAAHDGSRSTPEYLLDVASNFFSRTRWNRTFMLVRAQPIGY